MIHDFDKNHSLPSFRKAVSYTLTICSLVHNPKLSSNDKLYLTQIPGFPGD